MFYDSGVYLLIVFAAHKSGGSWLRLQVVDIEEAFGADLLKGRNDSGSVWVLT